MLPLPPVEKYSRTSLSQTRSFRITAYLEVNLVPVLTWNYDNS